MRWCWPLVAALGISTASAEDLSIPNEMYELENGLTVILAEDHSIPIVEVNVWYHVGSGDEVEGRTGFAHLFEHLMFQGSVNNDQDFFEPLQRIGASANGSTNTDRTNYHEGVPAQYMPLALWAEADRMGFLLPVLSEERLQNQKDVVRNERRQRYENPPYGTVWLTLLDNVFPEGHPYNHSTIGSHEDLEAATLDDVKAFFKKWYVPNNASLVVAGDFDPAQAKALIKTYFGDIPAGEDQPKAGLAPAQIAEPIEVRQSEVGAPHKKVWLAWPSPALYEPGDADLDVLSSILADGKDSRLFRHLVLDKELVTSVEAYQVSMGRSSMYIIEATAAADVDTDAVVAEIDAVLDTVRAEGVTDEEVKVAITNYEAGFLRRLAAAKAKADRLNSYLFFKGTPDYLQDDLQRYLDVSPQSVAQFVTSVFDAPRLTLHIHPEVVAEGGEQ